MSSLLREVADLLDERQPLYGDLVESWEEIGALTEQLSAPGDTPGMRVALTLAIMKLVRRRSSPGNVDHLRDALGYLDGMHRAQQAAAGEGQVESAGDYEAPRCVRGHVLEDGQCPRCSA